MLWIKEVEIVDSVEIPESSRSSREHHSKNFEMLDARIAPALKKIITNSYFKKGVSLEEQRSKWKTDFFEEGRLLFVIYEYFRVTGAHEADLDYTD